MEDRLPETQLLVKNLIGIDIKQELVPVQPAMHRPIGGIQINVQGATNMPGLYAAGECACVGVHGANRLGGNSLLECIVFGRRAGEAAADHARATPLSRASHSLLVDEERRTEEMTTRSGGEDSIGSLRRDLALTMHQKAGWYRSRVGLREARDKINELKERYTRVAISSTSGAYNPSLSTFLELGYTLDVAQVIVAGALARQESRGAHYRSDFPERDDTNWLQHTVASYTPEGPALAYKPVVVTEWQPQRRAY